MPKNKSSNETLTQEKMLDVVLASMSSFTDKLTSMESRLSGLALWFDETPVQKTSNKKSRLQYHSKKQYPPEEDDTPLFALPGGTILKNDAGDSYLKTFPDTVVLVKSSATPVRPKKQCSDLELGVAPLPQDNYKPGSVASVPVVKQAVVTFARPDGPATSQPWDFAPTLPAQLENEHAAEEVVTRDANHNIYRHVDQFGNPVQVQSVVEPLTVTMQQETVPVEKPAQPAVPPPVILDLLRMNSYIQQLVEERMAVLETRMKSEFQQGGSQRKKSGRYNVSDTLLVPSHLHWPNESCLTGAARRKTPFDDLSCCQFVIGFFQNVLDTPHPETSHCMLAELIEMAKLAENLSWPIARGAFAASLHQLEDQQIIWQHSRTLVDNRLTYSQAAVFSGSVAMSPKSSTVAQPTLGVRKVVCYWYNDLSCPHSQDHMDSTGMTLFKHVCGYCFKFLERSNGHMESDCFNKKKVNTSE